jgi:hypothetical protein
VPYGWVTALAEGGRLVLPLANTYYPPGIAVLTRQGEAASGSLAGPADFMALRSARVSRRAVVGFKPVGPHTASTSNLHPYALAGERDTAIAVGQRVPGVHSVWRPADEDTGCLWFYAPVERAIATLDTANGKPHEVEQTGTRQLFDEIEAAYRWWQDAGEPTVTDWLVTVDSRGQRIELEA